MRVPSAEATVEVATSDISAPFGQQRDEQIVCEVDDEGLVDGISDEHLPQKLPLSNLMGQVCIRGEPRLAAALGSAQDRPNSDRPCSSDRWTRSALASSASCRMAWGQPAHQRQVPVGEPHLRRPQRALGLINEYSRVARNQIERPP